MAKLLSVAFLSLAFSVAASANQLTVASLDESDSIEIEFRSAGCFHFQQTHISIRKLDRFVAQLSADGKDNLASVELSATDVAALDDLIAYYRALTEPGLCTTEETISLTWMKSGSESALEPFSDATCRAPAEGREVIQTLINLVREHSERPSNKQFETDAFQPARYVGCSTSNESSRLKSAAQLQR